MKKIIALALSGVLVLPTVLSAEPLTILNQWQSPNEMTAMGLLDNKLKAKSLEMTSVQPTPSSLESTSGIKDLARELAINDTVLSLSLEELRQWYDLRLLQSLSAVAQEQNWADNVPAEILEIVTHREQVIAAPINIHTSNWIWANKLNVDATGIDYTASWDNFLQMLQVLQTNGLVPMAHDGSPGQDLLLFETIYLADKPADEYVKLFDDFDLTALRNAEADFTAVLQKMQQLKPFIERLPAGSGWHETVAKLIDNSAGLIIQGDWAHGELARKGRIANQHYYCTGFPGDYSSLAIRVDAIATLNANAQPISDAQKTAIAVMMDKDTQYLFSNYKGGLPAISGTGLESISECLQYVAERKEQALATNTLVPSLSQGMAVREVVRREISEVVHEFMTTDMDPSEAAKQLQKRMKYANYLIN